MTLVLSLLLYTYIFYCGFLMYSSVVNRGWAKLPLFLKIILTPVGVIFLLMDVAFNAIVGTLLFLQLPGPGRWTLSMRMAGWISHPEPSYRKTLALFIVSNFLLPFTADY